MHPILIFAAWAIVVAVAGGLATDVGPWYDALRKPAWQPPRWLFAPAWTLIFALAAWAGVLAWRGGDSQAHEALAAVYVVNGFCNALWSPLFFKWKRPDWALVELPFLWVSTAAMIAVTVRLSPTAPWLLAPYLAWVSFAGVLNRRIVTLNAPFMRA